LSGCALREHTTATSPGTNEDSSSKQRDSIEQAPPPQLVEKPEPEAVCPTDEDIHHLIDSMKKLQTSSKLFLYQGNHESSIQSADKNVELERIKKRITEWKAVQTSASKNSFLLIAADGTDVKPEITHALTALSRSEEYLMKSLKACALKNDQAAKTFFSFAQDNLKHAEKISQMRNNWHHAKPLIAPATLTKAEDWLKEESP
jgi:hypothetical protein